MFTFKPRLLFWLHVLSSMNFLLHPPCAICSFDLKTNINSICNFSRFQCIQFLMDGIQHISYAFCIPLPLSFRSLEWKNASMCLTSPAGVPSIWNLGLSYFDARWKSPSVTNYCLRQIAACPKCLSTRASIGMLKSASIELKWFSIRFLSPVPFLSTDV